MINRKRVANIIKAFRDRNAGHSANQRRGTDEAPRGGPRGGRGARQRGGMFSLLAGIFVQESSVSRGSR